MVTSLDGINVSSDKKKHVNQTIQMYPTRLPGKLFVEQG